MQTKTSRKYHSTAKLCLNISSNTRLHNFITPNLSDDCRAARPSTAHANLPGYISVLPSDDPVHPSTPQVTGRVWSPPGHSDGATSPHRPPGGCRSPGPLPGGRGQTPPAQALPVPVSRPQATRQSDSNSSESHRRGAHAKAPKAHATETSVGVERAQDLNRTGVCPARGVV